MPRVSSILIILCLLITSPVNSLSFFEFEFRDNPFSPNQRDLAKAWLHIFPLFLFIYFFHKTLCDAKRMKDISGTRFRQPSSSRSSQLYDETHIMNEFRSSEKSSFLEFFRLVDLSMAGERLGGKTESSYVHRGGATHVLGSRRTRARIDTRESNTH